MKQNSIYKNFRVKRITHIEEIKVDLIEIVHEPSKAEIVHVACDDKENTFVLCFKTHPSDHSGVAHVLEHLVLCGSKKFDVGDPFFSMLSRSAHTFLNAFTASLWTAYPASTTIKKDFYNLLDVYLDAVFHPNLNQVSFLQEAHRLNFETEGDPKSDLIHSGVVYNEMIGVLSSATSLLWRKTMEFLFPGDNPYSFNSGGNPKDILNLSRDDLKAFHKRFYAPSVCNFFFYGNIKTEEHLDYLEENILKEAKPCSPIPMIPEVNRYKEKKRESLTYPTNETELKQKTFISFSWLTTDITKRDELLALEIIDFLLMDNDASLLKKSLIDSGLCLSADSGFDSDSHDVPYVLVCSGCDAESADDLEKVLLEKLGEIIETEFDEDMIESALHQIEFGRLEIGGSSYPYGIDLFYRTILNKMEGGSLEDGLKVHTLFAEIREKLKDKRYLHKLIDKFFISNNHMVRVVLVPDPEIQQKRKEAEKKELAELKKSLSQKDIDEILENSRCLKEYHEKKKYQDLSCLPMLKLDEVPKEVTYFPLAKSLEEGVSTYFHDCFTNKTIYADMIFDIPQIAESDLSYFRLFSTMLTGLGAGGKDYIETLKYSSEYLGGIGTQLAINVQADNVQTCYPTFALSAKCLSRNREEMFSLMRDYMLQLDYKDAKRIKELTKQIYSQLTTKIHTSAISYAIKQSSESFSAWAYITNQWYGLPYYNFIEDLAQNIDDRLPILMEKFAYFSKTLFHLNNIQLVLACDSEDYKGLQQEKFFGLSNFSTSTNAFVPWFDLPSCPQPENMGRILSTDIAHNAMSISTITIKSPSAAAVKLACYLAENLVIHTAIREQQGAYSTGIDYNILTGKLSFYSSRDPQVYSSHLVFAESMERIARGEFTDQDLLEAKLNYIQSVDAPAAPGHRGTITYFQKKVCLTRERRQEFRDQVFGVTKEAVCQAVKEFILPSIRENSVRVSYAGQSMLESANEQFKKAGVATLPIRSL